MINNGSFDSGANWTLITTPWSILNGFAIYDSTSFGHIRQTNEDMISYIENSKSYVLEFDIGGIIDPKGFAYFRIYSDDISILYRDFNDYREGHHQIIINTPVTGGLGGIDIYASQAGHAFTIDNVSLKECFPQGDDPYYIDNTLGNDVDSGTITSPWKTLQRAFDVSQPGDTTYIRGGIYQRQPYETMSLYSANGVGSSGTRNNYISYIGYPPDIVNGDSIIIDCSLSYISEPDYIGIEAIPPTATSSDNVGIILTYTDFIRFKNITLRNLYQKYRYVQTTGLFFAGATNVIVENFTLYNISGHGFYYSGGYGPDGRDSSMFINCDAYNCVDSFSVNVANYRDLPTAPQAGTWGNGFMITPVDKISEDTSAYVQILNCRAWHNADEGLNATPIGTVFIQNFWSFANGYHLIHDVYDNYTSGNGFKLNGGVWDGLTDSNIVQLHFYNNLIAFNQGYGYSENNNGKASLNRNIYNNTSYKNNSYGFIALNQGDTREYGLYKNKYVNNLAYDNYYADVGGELNMYINEYNSWNTPPGVTVIDGDFVLVDSILTIAELKASRKPDGSLPDITFMKLKEDSDLIDAGIDVGLSYNGSAPDLGYVEYEEEITGTKIIKHNGKIIKHNGKFIIIN